MKNKSPHHVAADYQSVCRDLSRLQAHQAKLQRRLVSLTLLQQLQRQGVTRPDSLFFQAGSTP